MFEHQYKDTFEQVVASPDTVREVLKLKNSKKTKRTIPMLAVAVLLIAALTTSVFAYTGFVIYENPTQMLDAFFGANALENGEGQILADPAGGTIVEPSFQREELDKDAAEEYLQSNIFAVGQSISHGGSTLTVDAYSFDPHTQCGLIYLHLDAPDGIPAYRLNANGEVVWESGPSTVTASEVAARFFVVPEATTDTCLTMACYFYQPDYYPEAAVVSFGGPDKKLSIPLEGTPDMQSVTLADGGIQISPIGIVIHGQALGHTYNSGQTRVDTLTIRYTDGSAYTIVDESGEIPLINCAYACAEPGDGYETQRNCITFLLNRIVPVGQVAEVVVNGTVYRVN